MSPAVIGLACLLAGLVIGGAWGYVGGRVGNGIETISRCDLPKVK